VIFLDGTVRGGKVARGHVREVVARVLAPDSAATVSHQ
jgi:hypothetical protein